MSNLFFDPAPDGAFDSKIMLATPVYDNPDASYTFSIQRSREALHAAGHVTAYLLLSGNCHVDDARNSIVQTFLGTDCTDLVFLDADVSWRPGDLLSLFDHDADVVGGVYPYRKEDKWRRGTLPFLPLKGAKTRDDGLLEVEGLPTGFMRIRRRVLEAMAADARTFAKKDDSSVRVPLIFERVLESDGKRWGGDLNFCRKWRGNYGGKIFALPELHLGHSAKTTVRDSLGAHMRRMKGETLEYVGKKVQLDRDEPKHIMEALDYVDNNFGARDHVLSLCISLARKAEGPILEIGSGLSTILMAAATEERVFCIEHDKHHVDRLNFMRHQSRVGKIALCEQVLRSGWYDLDVDGTMDKLPERFALAFVDGPPMAIGDRFHFFEVLGHRCDKIIVDDMESPDYARSVRSWAKEAGRPLLIDQDGVLLIGEAQ